MTLGEAAALLELSPRTLRLQIQKGKLRAKKLGPRMWVVTEAEVERYRRESLGKPGRKRGPK